MNLFDIKEITDAELLAAKFARATEKVRSKLIAKFTDLYGKYGGDRDRLIAGILSEDVGKMILEEIGLGEYYEAVLDEYDKVALGVAAKLAKNMDAFSVSAIKQIYRWTFHEHVRDVGQELKNVLIKGAFGGMSEKAMNEALLRATKKLSEEQIGALVNTNLRTLSRTAFSEMTKDLPENALYRYVGPSDDKMRPFCAEHIGDEMTREEWEALTNDQGGSAWIEGGGFNCRHSLELVTESEKYNAI